jgi:DNA-binding transcriptional ArsR family regulator
MTPGRAAAPNFSDAAPVFAALGDPTRLRVIARLCSGGPQSTVNLTRGARVSRQAISKHLQALESAGLVRSARAGRERIWELKTARLARARLSLEEISAHWDGALERLRSLVETINP